MIRTSVVTVLTVLITQTMVQVQAQPEEGSPVRSTSAAQVQTAAVMPLVPDNLRYNVVEVQTRAGYTVAGYYSGLVGDSIMLVSRGADVVIALRDLTRFKIATEADPGPSAVFGALAGVYFGSALFAHAEGSPAGYLSARDDFSAAYVLAALPGYAVFSLFNFSGSEVFTFSGDEQHDADEQSELKEYLKGGLPRSTVHLTVQGGWVSTRISSKPSGLLSHPSMPTYYDPSAREPESALNLNLLRRFQLTINVLPWLEAGVAYVSVSEPQMAGYVRSDINDSLVVFSGYAESFKGTAFLLVGIAEPLQKFLPSICCFKTGAGVGLGNVEVSTGRSSTTLERKRSYGPYTYWITQSATSSPSAFSEKRMALSVFGSADLRINRSVSVGLFADYTVLLGTGLPEVPEWNFASRALGNTCLGFALGWHF